MFGYVRVFKPELKIKEFEQYQSVYCSLCRQLGRRYGFWMRLTLSYDFAFLALLGMALSPDAPSFTAMRCPAHPLRRRSCCSSSPSLALAADAAVLLLYYKTRDTLADESVWRSLPARLGYPLAALAHRRAAKRQPQLDKRFGECMAAQAAVERTDAPSLDRSADPSAQLLAALAGALPGEEGQRLLRERLGYCLGRWIYFIDALDDWEDDRRRGRFNPFGSDPREAGTAGLNASLAECRETYEQLTVYRFDGILRNVWDRGLPAAQQRVLLKECYHESGSV